MMCCTGNVKLNKETENRELFHDTRKENGNCGARNGHGGNGGDRREDQKQFIKNEFHQYDVHCIDTQTVFADERDDIVKWKVGNLRMLELKLAQQKKSSAIYQYIE